MRMAAIVADMNRVMNGKVVGKGQDIVDLVVLFASPHMMVGISHIKETKLAARPKYGLLIAVVSCKKLIFIIIHTPALTRKSKSDLIMRSMDCVNVHDRSIKQ